MLINILSHFLRIFKQSESKLNFSLGEFFMCVIKNSNLVYKMSDLSLLTRVDKC